MLDQLKQIKNSLLDRMCEGTTWSGIGALCSMAGAHWAKDVDWQQLSGIGVTVAGVLHIVLPDKLFEREQNVKSE